MMVIIRPAVTILLQTFIAGTHFLTAFVILVLNGPSPAQPTYSRSTVLEVCTCGSFSV